MDCITATTFFYVFPLISAIFVWVSKAVWFCVVSPSVDVLWAVSCGRDSVVSSVRSSIPSLPSLVQHCIVLQLLAIILLLFFSLNLLSFTRQLLVPGYQEIWYTADGARKSSSPANNVRLWKWDVLTLLDDPAAPVSLHSCALIVFPLPATLFLSWGGLGRGRFKCCCEHVLGTQVQKMLFGHLKWITVKGVQLFLQKRATKVVLVHDTAYSKWLVLVPLGWCTM